MGLQFHQIEIMYSPQGGNDYRSLGVFTHVTVEQLFLGTVFVFRCSGTEGWPDEALPQLNVYEEDFEITNDGRLRWGGKITYKGHACDGCYGDWLIKPYGRAQAK